ncbi:MAG: thioredoxin family protein [bacterium]
MKNIGKIILGAVAITLLYGCDFGRSLKKEKITKIETRAEFDEALKCKKPVVAKFSGSRCAASKAMNPIFAKSAGKYYEDVKFIDVDVDKADGVAEEFKIQGIPAFIYFKDGERVKKIEGSMPQEELDLSIERFK